MKFARGSTVWITFPLAIWIIFLIIGLVWINTRYLFIFLAFVVLLKNIFFVCFFRDPDRNIAQGIVASADGRIREISNLKDKEIGDCIKISTFMNLYNVHVNRMPLDGTIKDVVHISGIHLPAFKKESEKNERVITAIDTKIGNIKIIQIAGTLARRILPYIKKEDKLKKGERIGIIRFGSRVDVYLPTKKIKTIHVKVGDMVKAGETTLAEIND